MQDILLTVGRNERRMILRAEEQARKSGRWPAWEALPIRPGMIPGNGWTQQVTKAHRNQVFCVLERPLANGVVHFAVTSMSQARPSWWEMQRIKNELAGESATAVEVYPPQSEVVDEADMFHFWVMPDGLPFSLREGYR